MADEEKLMDWKENDSLVLATYPEGLRDWLEFYQASDPRFSLSHFLASGVVLHFGDLPEAEINGDQQALKDYFIYSPDSSRYIDLFSYDHFMDKGMLLDGEADQQVTIADLKNGQKKQLLFNGPTQSADIAAWLNNDSFILALSSTTEDQKLNAQLLVFRISDSSYTNFNLDHSFPMDSLKIGPQPFSEIYTNKLRSQ